MKINIVTDGTAVTTGKYMHYMVDVFYKDMLPYIHLSILEVFNLIKRLPFLPDPIDRELLMRPSITMSCGGDCDDKCIAFASYCKLVNLPYQFIAARRKNMKRFHHVFCKVLINNKWIHADPTYSFNSLGLEREPFEEYIVI